ncbi:MAG: STAS domain-containing protein [Bryobacterales bacterium]|nr:STAS domain-containing protein [Bryobacterales bacterium]
MANAFHLTRTEQDGVVILALTGYLDAHTAPQFERAIEAEFSGGHTRLIADCAGLDYISSAGLGVFMSFIEDIRAAGGDIKLCAIVPKVYQVFDVLGFPEIFDIVDTPAAALERFRSGAAVKEV